MLFHTFDTQEERREHGGSAFMEMQFCRLPAQSEIEQRVAIDNIEYWKSDSLYIQDEETFYREYGRIFDCGFYNDLKSGAVDIYGVNYYAPAAAECIAKRVRDKKPLEYERLLDWLRRARAYNGFYILGI